MSKYAVAAALLVVYAAVATWVVRGEGESYRESLRRARARPPEVAADRSDETPAAPSPLPEPTVEAPSLAHPAKPAGAPTVVAKAEPREPERPAPAATPERAPAPPPPPPPASEADLKPDPLWLSPRMKEVWDPKQLGPAERRRLGAALHGLVLELNRPLLDGPYLRRAEKAAAPLLEGLARKDDYSFTILDSAAVNAFSHPGGHIYLTKGLFDFVGEDEDQDFVLQFVIGHEIAHVELGHAIRCLQDPDLARSGLGTLPQFFLFLFPLGYPDAMDFDADRWAFDAMTRRLDRTPHEARSFLLRYRGFAERNGFPNGRRGLKPVPDASPIDNHMRAHPAPYQRLDRLTAKPAAKPGP